jgi:hypothetical protein
MTTPAPTGTDLERQYAEWVHYIRENTIGDVRQEMLTLAAHWADSETERRKLSRELNEQYRAAGQNSVNVVMAALAGAELARREAKCRG